jgi:alkyl sulfatase BDS1-like metallo-beta-lactamase superfamily hydrolase
MDHAVAENVYAGNAMSRRLFFQYGVLLPRSPFGHGNRGRPLKGLSREKTPLLL